MGAEPANLMVPPQGTRKVWVCSRGSSTHEEEFKGQMYRIPPNGKKEVLMALIDARHFLARPNGVMHHDGQGHIIGEGKPLYTVELTDEERQEHDPLSLPEEIRKTIEKANQAVANRQATLGQRLKASVADDR